MTITTCRCGWRSDTDPQPGRNLGPLMALYDHWHAEHLRAWRTKGEGREEYAPES